MDLTTRYLGLTLKNPIVPSSSPLTRHVSVLRQLEDAGAAAVVLYSLFEEEIEQESYSLDQYLSQGVESFAEALSYLPEAPAYRRVGPEPYLNHIRQAKASLDIPIIASLNGVSPGGWTRFARDIELAGADALELNLYFIAANPDIPGATVEQIYFDVLAQVKEAVSIPVALKLNPYFSSLAHTARGLAEAGADGLVLFNRFYQPDLDLENLEVVQHLKLSTSYESKLPLRWLAILYGRVAADLALTTGIHTAEDALKGIAAGAQVVMMASALLRHGIGRISEVLEDMQRWLIEHEYPSLEVLRGSLSQVNCAAPAAFERANYVQLVGSYDPIMLDS